MPEREVSAYTDAGATGSPIRGGGYMSRLAIDFWLATVFGVWCALMLAALALERGLHKPRVRRRRRR